MRLFKDRRDAGQRLAVLLKTYAEHLNVIVLALPRGGVPVAFEIAKALKLPMDLLLVRKLGLPGHEELAMGAIVGEDICILNEWVIESHKVSASEIEAEIVKERKELMRRNQLYRQGQPFCEVSDKIVILVDDGIATGATAEAAIKALHQQGPKKIILAVPLAPSSTLTRLGALVDQVVCLETPEPFYGVGLWYEDFSQLTDAEVIDLVQASRESFA